MNDIQLIEKSGKYELHICDDSSWSLFEKIANVLEYELKGVWLEKLDGMDQRYWDLKIEDEIVTLHLEHYLGLYVFSDSLILLVRSKSAIEKIGI